MTPPKPPRRPLPAAPLAPVATARAAPGAERHVAERHFSGLPVSPGVAIGPAFGTTEPRPQVARRSIRASDTGAELARLEAAIVQSRRQLRNLSDRLALLPEDSQAEIAPLIEAYQRMLGPSRLVRGAQAGIAERRLSAEAAVQEQAESIAAALLALPAAPGSDDAAARLRQAEEIREIGRRLVRNLTQTPFRSFANLPEGGILVAEQLRPADAALLNPARVAGVVTDEGGTDGHTAVMLRALGVPAVLGAAGLSAALSPGDVMVVDGGTGRVVLNPNAATLAQARRDAAAHARSVQRLGRLRRLPAVTLDRMRVELQANLELPVELSLIAQSGAAGIGLLRSEFLFMNRDRLPDEAAQAEVYRSVVEAMEGDPVTIRVLDWGGEKVMDALDNAGLAPRVDVNPALGLRGIRLLLRHPQLLETQLAAILQAGNFGPVRVLLPMVTNLAEVRASREIYERVQRRLRRRGTRLPETPPPLGIMIETPGAALSADALALEADFFAIGSNDLTMYTLAVDRGESDLAQLYDPLHPAVLRLIQFATDAALRQRKPVSVCGEMAANARLTPLLIGLGLRSFSMNAAAVPRVKQAVREVSTDDCVRLARRVMEQVDPARIHALFADFGHP